MNLLRQYIRKLISEGIGDVVKLGVTITIDNTVSLTDVYTELRSVLNVISVNQVGEKMDKPDGTSEVNLYINFHDDDDDDVYSMKKAIIKAPGITDVVIKNYRGQRWSDIKDRYTGGAASEFDPGTTDA